MDARTPNRSGRLGGCLLALAVAFSFLPASRSAADNELPAAEFQVRRQAIMGKLPDGILLLHARAALFSIDQIASPGFRQDPTFYYFTGLENAVSAILAIDGRKKESWLFVPSRLDGIADWMRTPFVKPGAESAKHLLVDHVVDWDQFIPYLTRQIESDPSLVLYTEQVTPSIMTQPPARSNPEGLAPVDDASLLWRLALEQRWPNAEIRSASEHILQMHHIKSPAEIEVMRRAARVTAGAALAGIRAIQPGQTQRTVETEVVRECLTAGGDGVAFWPLAMSGPNSRLRELLEGVSDYFHANRVMNAGEVVHLDLGCEVGLYGSDVGRTIPVSGKFTEGQRETVNLLVHAYQAGLAVMRNGVTRDEVYEASVGAVRRLQGTVKTDLAKAAVEKLLGKGGTDDWFLHSAGLGGATTSPTILQTGMVVVFEPYVNFEEQGFYLEDPILITDDGYEVLTPDVPYFAEDIEKTMAAHEQPR